MLMFNTEGGRGTFLSDGTLETLLRLKSGGAALLYLYIQHKQGRFDPAACAEALAMDPKDILVQLDLLEKSGLVTRGGEAPELPEVLPGYSARDIDGVLQGDTAFNGIVAYTKQRLGRPLTTNDISTLLGLYDSLGLPAGVIMLLVGFICERDLRRYGPGHRITLRQIEREAFRWSRDGILTETGADAYIQKQMEREEDFFRIRGILMITGRAPTKSEASYMEKWLSLGLCDGLIEAAYDRTVLQTGGLKWGYMNKILESWAEKGIRTVEEIETKDSRRFQKKGAAPGAGPSGVNAAERLKKMRLDGLGE
ncbi:DnaD domain protein [Oscillospiraceae bacterium OttesenSCG-928-F05]|nr:DnaD domain protein [Oscillospiraceae bacterium OttesenSCG-928-F05]